MFTRDDLVALLQTADPDVSDVPVDLFAEIALQHSKGDPLAHHENPNGSYDRGLWMINSIHESEFPQFSDFRQACYTPLFNAQMAIAIFRKQGLGAWPGYQQLL